MESEKRMLLDVNEFPKSKGQAFILALQHVLAMIPKERVLIYKTMLEKYITHVDLRGYD